MDAPANAPASSTSSPSDSSSPPAPPSFTDSKPRTAPPSDEAQDLDCNICLFSASEPVVSRCGHLYCWPCLHQWLHSGHPDCPVCKARINQKGDIIPLYGRSSRATPRPTPTFSYPPRPTPHPPPSTASTPPHRPPPPPTSVPLGLFSPFTLHPQHGTFSFSAGYGLFPAIFGLQFAAFQLQEILRGDGAEEGEEGGRDARLSRFLMFLGIFMLLLLLMY